MPHHKNIQFPHAREHSNIKILLRIRELISSAARNSLFDSIFFLQHHRSSVRGISSKLTSHSALARISFFCCELKLLWSLPMKKVTLEYLTFVLWIFLNFSHIYNISSWHRADARRCYLITRAALAATLRAYTSLLKYSLVLAQRVDKGWATSQPLDEAEKSPAGK
jgi:hypothetical protein